MILPVAVSYESTTTCQGPLSNTGSQILSVSSEMRCEMSPVAGLVRVVPLDRAPLRN